MFECTETEEFIYNGVVEPSYKKSTREDSNRSGHNRKMRGESALSNTYSKMSEISINHRKRYVHHPKYRPKHKFIIHGPGHSSYDCKVLGEFGYKYYKIRPTKDRGYDTATRKKFNRKK